MLSRISLLAVLKEFASATINAGLSLAIARQVDATTYSSLVSLLLLAGSLAQVNRGIQFAAVDEFLQSTNNEYAVVRVASWKIGLVQYGAWLIFSAVLAGFVQINFCNALAAGIILPTTILSALYSAHFQARVEFAWWQSWLLATNLLQIPLVGLVIMYGLPLWFYLLSFSIPTLVTCAILMVRSRPTLNSWSINIASAKSSGLYYLALFANFNLITVLGQQITDGNRLGSHTLLFFPLGVSVGLASVFGSFNLPKTVTAQSESLPTSFFSRLTLKFVVFFTVVGFLVFGFQNIFAESILGTRFTGNFGLAFTLIASLSFVPWAYAYWTAQGFTWLVTRESVVKQIVLLLTESFCLIVFQPQLKIAVILHGIIGIASCYAILDMRMFQIFTFKHKKYLP